MKNYYANDDIGAIKHFVEHGMAEGRQGKDTFDVKTYKNMYPDLRNNFGNDLKKYYIHYINHGYKENRKTIGGSEIIKPVTILNGVDYDYNNPKTDKNLVIGTLVHFVYQ